MLRLTVGSKGGAGSYERGTPVELNRDSACLARQTLNPEAGLHSGGSGVGGSWTRKEAGPTATRHPTLDTLMRKCVLFSKSAFKFNCCFHSSNLPTKKC